MNPKNLIPLITLAVVLGNATVYGQTNIIQPIFSGNLSTNSTTGEENYFTNTLTENAALQTYTNNQNEIHTVQQSRVNEESPTVKGDAPLEIGTRIQPQPSSEFLETNWINTASGEQGFWISPDNGAVQEQGPWQPHPPTNPPPNFSHPQNNDEVPVNDIEPLSDYPHKITR
jgi:hypothetical protein